MICKKCGAEFDEGKFCPVCGNEVIGEKVETEVVDVTPNNETVNNNSKHEKLWSTFANIGFIIGIIAFVASFILPYAVLSFDVVVIASIVFSCLGKKSFNNSKKAKKGLGFSIAALIISIVLSIVYALIFETIIFAIVGIGTAGVEFGSFEEFVEYITNLIQGNTSEMTLFIR